MCYDQEKTQTPDDGRVIESMRREKEAFHKTREGQHFVGTADGSRMTDEYILKELFRSHPPNEFTLPKYAAINQAAKNFAEVVLQNCPPGNDRGGAIASIRMARMIANAAISLNGLNLNF